MYLPYDPVAMGIAFAGFLMGYLFGCLFPMPISYPVEEEPGVKHDRP